MARRLKEEPKHQVCPCCGAGFSHNAAMECCKRCGITDQLIAGGPKKVKRYAAKAGYRKPRPTRYRRPHGRQGNVRRRAVSRS